MSDELAGEGATQFEDIESGGLGEGEGVKDVSEQLESEDQLDEARKPDDKKEEEQQDDVRDEEHGVEMSEDFDAKMQDVDATGATRHSHHFKTESRTRIFC